MGAIEIVCVFFYVKEVNKRSEKSLFGKILEKLKEVKYK